MRPRSTECLVIGGGAAGATLAWLLAREQVDVVLVDDGRAHYSGLYETVLAGTREAWGRMGLLDGLGSGVELDPLRHGAIWGSDELAWREDPEPGLLLRRGAFDRALQEKAKEAGASVLLGHRATPDRECWRVGDATLRPRVVVFATGRRQAVPGLAESERSDTRTAAVSLQGVAGAGARGSAVVEAVADGWLWYTCPEDGPAAVTALLDTTAGRSGLRGSVARMLEASVGPAAQMREWQVIRANDASPWRRGPCSAGMLIGDAAGTIDPLASQGVEKAVAAAERAAAAVVTSLERPEWWGRLCRAHDVWERELCAAHWQVSADFYAAERRFAGSPFWRARALRPEMFAEAGALDPRAPISWRADVAPAPALLRHGPTFVEVAGLRRAGDGQEVARAGRVACASLFDLLDGEGTAAQACARAAGDARFVTSSPQEVGAAIEWLFAKGWLIKSTSGAPGGR